LQPSLQQFSSKPGIPDPATWMQGLFQDPARFAALQSGYLASQARLWSDMVAGADSSVVGAEAGDKRFGGKEWRENPYYSYLRQSYLLAARFLSDLAEDVQLDPVSKERLRFAVKQWSDALCPANFAATNPAVLKRALETQGESLTQGLANLIADTQKGRLSQTDETAFEVGRNLALTPGDVVFENDLIQLIQYAPTTPKVAKRPLVMVPPAINKFYILDLQPENSFVRHAVAQGHTVYMVSWRNVGPDQGRHSWDDYLSLGVLKAIEVAKAVAKSKQVNALGFCVGGTLLGASLAVMAAKGDDSVASATFLATMLDFESPGQVGLFVDAPSLALREASIGAGGILPGSDLAGVFSMLRANDLIWPYVVNNYLLGGEPPAFDLLYWNADSTNLPGPMYCYYVRNTYLENRLREAGALQNLGVPVDLGKVNVPSFIVATREDHIVPWPMAFRSLGLLGGEKQFVLGASGHIAGIVNPPAAKRRSYWIGGDAAQSRPDPEQWLASAQEQRGSWWPAWWQWLERFKGGEREAPAQAGNAQYRAIEPAPGRYVKQKAQ
jgi:polyhydroxyalkanoate synthase